MPRGDQPIDHLLRRAGFGATSTELALYNGMPLSAVIDLLLEYQRQPDNADDRIGNPSYLGVTPRGSGGQFSPNTNIEDARQRWLFRMVHAQRPLQEKMTLFWHQHFATAYSKIASAVGALQGTKMMALAPGEFPGPPGQVEVFRTRALGKFRDLLVEVAKNPAMLIWLDGRTNTKARPQENFGREVMELFTFGVGHYTEQDVYAAARVFTGWNMKLNDGGSNDEPNSYYEFVFNASQHETAPKSFTFPIYPNGGTTIAARSAEDGMQDGLDFLAALARHPETARRLARRMWTYFVTDQEVAPADFVEGAAQAYLRADTEIKAMVDYVLRSPWFFDPRYMFARYAWPVEYVVRAIKEIGWQGFSADAVRSPLVSMGQALYEPPDVNGWEIGSGWITTGTMLARMNFAASLASNQKASLAKSIPASARSSADGLVDAVLDRLTPMPYAAGARSSLASYVAAGSAFTGTDAQVTTKASGLTRLIVGSAEYQFV